MLKIDYKELERLDRYYLGLKDQVIHLEGKDMPAYPHCGSRCTALVGVGVVGRSLQMAVSTTRFRLWANGPRQGKFACASCRCFFDD